MDTLNWNCLKSIQTTKKKKTKEGFKDLGEDDHEQPLSPMTRLFHEPGANIYIIAILGMKTRIDPDVFKTSLVQLIASNPRFSSLQVVGNKNGSMRWVPSYVNIHNHVFVTELDPNMKLSSIFVENYISNLSRSGNIEMSKPLWDVHILSTNAKSTCVFRIHHSIGDGMSFMNLLLAFSHKTADPKTLPTLPVSNDHRSKATSFRSRLMVLWNSLVAVVVFMLTALFMKDTETPIKGSGGDRPRRFVSKTVSLDDIKMVKNFMNVTVNDVVTGILEAGLYRYLNRRYGGAGENNESVPKNVRLKAIIPFNLRASTMIDIFTNRNRAWGNKLGYVLLPLNMKAREDPLDYIREVKAKMERKKASLEPYWTELVANLVIKLFSPKIAGKVNHKVYSSVSLCFSNVPGPQEEISFFGYEVDYLAASGYGLATALLIHVVSQGRTYLGGRGSTCYWCNFSK